MAISNKKILFLLILGLIALAIYSYGMNSFGLTDPDETFYAQTAKEMIERNNLMVPFIFGKPQFEKPIFFYWLLAIAFKIFGITEWSARFWPAIFGTLGVIITFLFGEIVFNRITGIYASIILMTSFLYIGLSRIVLTDIILTTFILLSLFFFYLGYMKSEKRYFIFSYIFAGFAVLTKGPIGILIPFCIISLYLAFQKQYKILYKFFTTWIGWLMLCLIALPWYIFITLQYGKMFLYSFFIHENINRYFIIAEHPSNNHWFFYPTIILLGMFPWSNLLPFLFTKGKEPHSKQKNFLYCWIWFTLLFFTFAKSKLASYILPLFPALSLLLAYNLFNIKSNVISIRRNRSSIYISTLITLIIFGVFSALLYYTRKYYPYAMQPLIALEIIFFIPILISLFLIYKRKIDFLVAINFVSVFISILLTINYIMPQVQGSFTDRDLLSKLTNKASIKKKILCNKMFVRGVYYYTRWPVAVIKYGKYPFYTPHPIEVLSPDLDLKRFFKDKEDIVCVLKGSDLEYIERATNGIRKNYIIYKNGERNVVISKLINPK